MLLFSKALSLLTHPYYLPIVSGSDAVYVLAASLERFPEAIILRDAKGRIFFLNRKAEEIFLISRDAVAGKMLNELAGSETSRLQHALALPTPLGADTRFTLAEGEHMRAFTAWETLIPLKKRGGISLRGFRETTREEELSRLKTQFLSIAAHQMRNPVATLQWVVQMFLAGEIGPVTDAQREMLQRTRETLNRMENLISDLLDVTRMQEGRFNYDFQTETSFPSFVKTVAEGFQGRATVKGLQLKFQEPTESFPPLLIDKSRLALALENVIANALAYTIRGEVTVCIRRSIDQVAVVVSDTGIGIPAEEHAKLFSKFFRASNTAQHGIDGTGLGLFLVRNIMHRHGGNATIESKEGKGTIVTLLLPIDPSRVPVGDMPIDEVVV